MILMMTIWDQAPAPGSYGDSDDWDDRDDWDDIIVGIYYSLSTRK